MFECTRPDPWALQHADHWKIPDDYAGIVSQPRAHSWYLRVQWYPIHIWELLQEDNRDKQQWAYFPRSHEQNTSRCMEKFQDEYQSILFKYHLGITQGYCGYTQQHFRGVCEFDRNPQGLNGDASRF